MKGAPRGKVRIRARVRVQDVMHARGAPSDAAMIAHLTPPFLATRSSMVVISLV